MKRVQTNGSHPILFALPAGLGTIHGMKTLRLITIPISHYCEKARWALEWCNIPYLEERHLQVFHLLHVYRAGKNDTAPVLVTSEGTFGDSTDILKWADAKAPSDLKLYPTDPVLKQEVEKFEDYLDEEFGVVGRLWMYTYMLKNIPLLVNYSKRHGVPWYESKLLPLVFPLFKKVLHRVMGVTATSREDSEKTVNRVFDEVALKVQDGRPFLMGDRFSAADLTFASLSAGVLIPDDYGVVLPSLEELPDGMKEQVQIWRDHPAGQFALKMFREYRRPQANRTV